MLRHRRQRYSHKSKQWCGVSYEQAPWLQSHRKIGRRTGRLPMRALHPNMPVPHKPSRPGSKEARMNWRMLDLNLLVVFDAVVQERSATRAAARLNMTQPAISHALARLRTALRDDLFVRTPDGMEPTPYAERLVGPVRTALENLQTALDGAA